MSSSSPSNPQPRTPLAQRSINHPHRPSPLRTAFKWRTTSTPIRSKLGNRADKENDEQSPMDGVGKSSLSAQGHSSTPTLTKPLWKVLQTLSITHSPLPATTSAQPVPSSPCPSAKPILSLRAKQRITSSRHWPHPDLLGLVSEYHSTAYQTASIAARRNGTRRTGRKTITPVKSSQEGKVLSHGQGGDLYTGQQVDWRTTPIPPTPPYIGVAASSPFLRVRSRLHRIKHGPDEIKGEIRELAARFKSRKRYMGDGQG